VRTPDFGDGEETSQSIGSDVGSGRERRAGKLADSDSTERGGPGKLDRALSGFSA
jgi:hypothetical protein